MDEERGSLGVIAGSLVALLLASAAVAILRSISSDPEGSHGRVQPTGEEPSIDLSQIIDVVPRDAIPAIDEPVFQQVSEVDWLSGQEPVISLQLDGEAKAYPLQIMTWHEIVNDDIDNTAVAVTFCPLCNTAIVFKRPEVDGSFTTFGTSGSLYNSNLLMYDRATESLWPQATGEAVKGPLSGQQLERIPAQIVAWEDFKNVFPQGQVLSRDTGYERSYGSNPYPGYDNVDTPPFLFTGEIDGRLAAVERVLGVQSGDRFVAFPYFRLEQQAGSGVTAVNATVGPDPVVVFWKEGASSALDETDIASSKNVGAAVAFSRSLGEDVLDFTVEDGEIVDTSTGSTWNIFGKSTSGELVDEKLEGADAFDTFWFDWAAFHPSTSVWDGK